MLSTLRRFARLTSRAGTGAHPGTGEELQLVSSANPACGKLTPSFRNETAKLYEALKT